MDDINSGDLPSVLAKLGVMTSIRDTELLEQSLLKTLEPLLGVFDTALYRTDENNNLVRIIHHHRTVTTDRDAEKSRLRMSRKQPTPFKHPLTRPTAGGCHYSWRAGCAQNYHALLDVSQRVA